MTTDLPSVPKQPPAAVISTVRGFTPAVVGVLTLLLAKANVHLDNQWLTDTTSGLLAAAATSAWTFGVRLLETHVAPWWGRLFIIAKAPAYAPGPAPQPAPYVGTHRAS